MSGRRDSAQRALNASVSFLHHSHHTAILDALDAEGLLDGEEKRPNGGRVHAVAGDAALPKRPLLTPVQCAAAKNGANRDLLRSVTAQAKRMGYTIEDDKHVDVGKLDAAMKGRDVTERLALKSALAKLALIP
jgi:hypothetical protein